MKKILMLVVALMAFAPVTVEGQTVEENVEWFVNALIQTRSCERTGSTGDRFEQCTYKIPGLEFTLTDFGSLSIKERARDFAGLMDVLGRCVIVTIVEPPAIAILNMDTQSFEDGALACIPS